MARFFAWLGRGLLNVRGLFPFTHEGRATLVYLMFAGAGPAVMFAIIYGLRTIRDWTGAPAIQRLDRFAEIVDKLGWGMVIVLVTMACFISIRAFKLNVRTGSFDVDGNSAGSAAQAATDAGTAAAQATTDEIKSGEAP